MNDIAFENLRPAGLRARIAAGAVALAVVVAAVLAVLAVVVVSLRSAGREARRSQEVVAVLNRYERTVLDLETGQRGYVNTGDERFLDPWRRALAELPRESERLEELLAGQPEQLRHLRTLDAAAADFRNNWSVRVVRLARRDREHAADLVATGGGKRRVDRIRGRVAA